MRKLFLLTGVSLTLLISAAVADGAAIKSVGSDAAVAMPDAANPISRPLAGFGDAILFVPAAYTPSGITNLVRSPLASQNRSGFGDAILFVPAAYTPPGITNLVRSPLASQNRSGFGDAILFVPAAYTPSGIGRYEAIGTVAAQ